MVRVLKPRYFVMQLADDDPERNSGYEFEIQILDSKGRAKATGYVGPVGAELTVEDHVVPPAVIEAARSQPKGKGDFVNKNGERVHPITGAVR